MKKVNETDRICPSCGQPVETEVPLHHLMPGTLLKGRYYMGKALGQGGFGITYAGVDVLLDRKIAVKEYYPNGFVNRFSPNAPTVLSSSVGPEKDFFEKGKQRFLMEAKTLAGCVGNQGVVDVLDYFEENNTAYIVMEYIEGVPMSRYIVEHGTLSVGDTLSLLLPVMQSLREIHARNVIHRDISPDNIMLTEGVAGLSVKLIDFGAARETSPEGNRSLTVMLKPGYAPFEQYGARDPQGPWTDVYALCATIYKCVTGVTPVASPDRIRSDDLKLPSALCTEIDPYTEAVLMKGLSLSFKDRFRSVDDLLDALLHPTEDRLRQLSAAAGSARKTDDGFTLVLKNVSASMSPTLAVDRPTAVSPANSRSEEASQRTVLAGKKKRSTRKTVFIAAAGAFLILLGVFIPIVYFGKQTVDGKTNKSVSVATTEQKVAVTQKAGATASVPTTEAKTEAYDPYVDSINFSLSGGVMKYVRVEKANAGLTEQGDACVFVFEFTNNLSTPIREWDYFTILFYQHGVALNEATSYSSLGGDQFDLVNASLNEVLSGGTMTFARLVLTPDDSPVTILVKYRNAGDGDPYQMMEVDLDQAYASSPAGSGSGNDTAQLQSQSGSSGGSASTGDGNATNGVPVYTGEPIVFSGDGDRVISPISVPYRIYKVVLTNRGSSNFIVHAYNAAGDRVGYWANEIGNYEGSVFLADNIDGGMIEIKSGGSWTVSIESIPDGGTSNIAGSGDWVSPWFTLKNGALAVSLTNSGNSNFIVRLYDEQGSSYSSLVNEIGLYNGSTVFNKGVPGARYCIEIVSEGDWTVDFGLGDRLTKK